MSGSQSTARYEIRVQGVLDQRWTAWFEGLQVTSDGSQTVICGPLPDQPALHGVLIKVRDLGMCLISVRRWTQRTPGRRACNETPTSSRPSGCQRTSRSVHPPSPAGPAPSPGGPRKAVTHHGR